MSYEEFRRRIDTARQILVGAVPSPAGQIDQITYALMYKFMNDIDDESAALGGKRSYFVGEYAKFNWHELMSTQLGAHERLELYREAIQTMAKNENLPELFRSIYQNAFLPFNSANVLTLFLKEIDKFSHGESDDIGDAYEYLLSITGAQGDVGQFRTPRHIIKFIVEAVNPTKDDKVLDPAVGTAGFLIAAYNHVKSQHDGKNESGERNDEMRLTADELHKIHHNYRGFDIDPTMVRTAKINMYLHGFKTPDIINHDSLSSEEYWNDWYDVILANPPFMTPKGGIQPHKKFGISANRAEVLFVDYIASHLKPNGRAGIVVPEGIIFTSGKAYKELRKNLVENYLYAVVSLPAGVFQPYSGVKTSVLLFDKELAKQRDEILFVKVENDGYSLGAQRRPLPGNQLPEALHDIERFKKGRELQTELAHSVSRKKIADSGDYSLSGDRYKIKSIASLSLWPTARLDDICDFIGKGIRPASFANDGGSIPFIVSSLKRKRCLEADYHEESLIIGDGGSANIHYLNEPFSASDHTYILKEKPGANARLKYIYYMILNNLEVIEQGFQGQGLKNVSKKHLKSIELPLPPIEIQREIVAELDGYQKIIDAAQTIIQTYKPTIKINPEWESKPFKEVATLEYGKALPSRDRQDGSFPVLGSNGVSGTHKEYLVAGPGVVVGRKGSAGEVTWVENNFFPIDTTYYIKLVDEDKSDIKFIYFQLSSMNLQQLKNGAGIPGLNREDVYAAKQFALPPIEIQREIVAELEAEQQLIDANKKLIEIYQQKIESKIAEIWGE